MNFYFRDLIINWDNYSYTEMVEEDKRHVIRFCGRATNDTFTLSFKTFQERSRAFDELKKHLKVVEIEK